MVEKEDNDCGKRSGKANSGWQKRVLITQLVEEVRDKVSFTFHFEEAAAMIGVRVTTIDGCDGNLIRIQGVNQQSFDDAYLGEATPHLSHPRCPSIFS